MACFVCAHVLSVCFLVSGIGSNQQHARTVVSGVSATEDEYYQQVLCKAQALIKQLHTENWHRQLSLQFCMWDSICGSEPKDFLKEGLQKTSKL